MSGVRHYGKVFTLGFLIGILAAVLFVGMIQIDDALTDRVNHRAYRQKIEQLEMELLIATGEKS